MATKILLPLMALVLAGCGGGGSDTPSSLSAAAAPCVPLVQVRVQLFGDSTMWGYDSFTKVQALPSPATDLQNEMDARFGRGAVVVSLNAVSGSSAKALLDGTAGYQPFPQGVAADLVVFNYGINDQAGPGIGEPIDEYESILRQLVKLSPAPVLFETPNMTPGVNANLAAYAQRMRDVAASVGAPVADTYAYVDAIPNFESYFADLAHPNTELYRLIVQNSLAPAVAKQVAPLLCR